MKPKVVIISGPTSAGKSEIAVAVAKEMDGEIVSADSMQVYKGMNIGTGKLSKDEMQGITHHLIDVLEPDEKFNVSKFVEMAREAIDGILSRGKFPIIVGGTGFYIRSLLYTGDTGNPGKDAEYKSLLKERADNGELPSLYDELIEKDPEYCRRITRNDRSRVIRALEYINSTGEKYSDYCDSVTSEEPIYDASFFVLDCERSILYKKMDERIDRMFDEGLVNEVESLLSRGIDRDCTSLNGIGYKEVARYLSGEVSLDEAKRLVKSNTHRYAVRQCTWFRNQEGTVTVDCSSAEDASKEILAHLRG